MLRAVWTIEVITYTHRKEATMKSIKRLCFSLLIFSTTTIIGLTTITTAAAEGIVSSVIKAPITPEGDVTDSFTDLVITLDSDLDPTVPGRTLLEGNTIRVIFPDGFTDLGLPIALPGPPPNCPPPAFNCNTGVILQGWPQHPIPPVPSNYTLAIEAPNTIVYTASRDLEPFKDGPTEPGIKQLHAILNGFINPRPGVYRIHVEAETGPGGALETGSARIHIRPKPRASINVTSVFNSDTPNTIYQETGVGDLTPLEWSFLLWDKKGDPATGVGIRQVNRRHAQLVNGNKVVGQISVSAPPGAKGQSIGVVDVSTAITGPVLRLPTALLTVNFRVGDTAGLYIVTLQMNNGNRINMYANAN